MKISYRLLILFVTAFSCVGCDQASKLYAARHLPKDHMDTYLFDILRLGYIQNTGAFLGMGSELSDEHRFWLFSVFASVLLLCLFVYLLFNRPGTTWTVTGLALILSGGASNLFDRLVNNGAVIDFLNVGVGTFRTGIFNLADMAILAGTLVTVLAGSLFAEGTEK